MNETIAKDNETLRYNFECCGMPIGIGHSTSCGNFTTTQTLSGSNLYLKLVQLDVVLIAIKSVRYVWNLPAR